MEADPAHAKAEGGTRKVPGYTKKFSLLGAGGETLQPIPLGATKMCN